MKTKIEEAAESHMMSNINQATHITREMVKSFIAGAEFMQKENNELETRIKIQGNNLHHYTTLQIQIEEKLKVAVEALENAKAHQGSLMIGSVKTVSSTYRILDSALEKIKGTK